MGSRSVVDVSQLARDMGVEDTEEVRRFAPPNRRADIPLPSYVQHQDGVGQLGTLSAAAIISLFETAARDIDAMGAELKTVATRCEALLAQVHGVIEEISGTARQYRAEGKRIFDELENCDKITQRVAATCEAMRNQIATAVAAV
jgi:hypothetical protein